MDSTDPNCPTDKSSDEYKQFLRKKIKETPTKLLLSVLSEELTDEQIEQILCKRIKMAGTDGNIAPTSSLKDEEDDKSLSR